MVLVMAMKVSARSGEKAARSLSLANGLASSMNTRKIITSTALVMKAMKKREVRRTRGPICLVRSRSASTDDGTLSSVP